ncbi:MAG: PilZ domain-containing protein [Planctomycetes bacterium]|nr:PilZ domain-containing protein [Planctomycetota bacterium]
MKQDKTNPRIRGRQSPRVDLQSDVTIDLEANTLVGSGDNISLQGVFFTTDEPITVTVHVADHCVVRGKLVRLESMGDGRYGIAVRFDEAQPHLLPPQ